MLAVLIANHGTAADRPNILLFMADDMTYSDLGCYGNQDVKTPRLDAFSETGLRFNKCFNSAPMCSPLRQSLYTGLYPVRNGAHPNHSQVYDWVKSLPSYLNEVGYRSALLGKRHEAPLEQFPFEYLGGRNHDAGDGLDLDLSKAEKYLAARAEDKRPFCLVVTSNQPHRPWNRGDDKQYVPSKLTIPDNLVDTQQTRKWMADYYAEITYMDSQFGRCLDALDEHGLAESTLVIFLSEQGSNFPFCKWTCYTGGIRAAAIIRYPANPQAGQETDALVSYVDVLPTLLELAGATLPEAELDGFSFAGLLRGASYRREKPVFAVQTSRGIYNGPEAYGIRAVTDGRYLLIRNLNYQAEFENSVTAKDPVYASWKAKARGKPALQKRVDQYVRRPGAEFYDLENDPLNLNNLIGESSGSAKRLELEEALRVWMLEQGDLGIATEMDAKNRQVQR